MCNKLYSSIILILQFILIFIIGCSEENNHVELGNAPKYSNLPPDYKPLYHVTLKRQDIIAHLRHFAQKHEKNCNQFGLFIYREAFDKTLFTMVANCPKVKKGETSCGAEGFNRPFLYTRIDDKWNFLISTGIEEYIQLFRKESIEYNFPCNKNWYETVIDTFGKPWVDNTQLPVCVSQISREVIFVPPKELEESGKVVPEESDDW